MAPIAIFFGGLLTVLGGVLYAMAETKSVTALIPSFFGLALIALGFVARLGDKARMHAMHGAALLGLIGLIVPLVRAVPAALDGNMTLPVIGQFIMAALCGVFLALCVKSFIDVRRARKAKES